MKKIIKKTISKTKHTPKLTEVTGSDIYPSVPVDINLENPTTDTTISLLELDLGRGDLNILRDKLNEVILKINA